MKLMIASDLHGSAYYTEKLIAAYRGSGAERLILLGDILYHGPRNDLPEGYEVTCPDYMVVYNSQKSAGFIVSSTGVYLKTDDPENPIGEAVVVSVPD